MFAAMSAISSVGQHVLSPDCELSFMEPAEAFYAKQVMSVRCLSSFFVSKFVWGSLKIFHIGFIYHAKKRNHGKAGCVHVIITFECPAVYYIDRTVLTDVVFFTFSTQPWLSNLSLYLHVMKLRSWYLSADLQEECFVRHLSWMFLIGIPQLIVYVIGMPLVSWALLMVNRWRLHKKRVRFRYGLLYSGYGRRFGGRVCGNAQGLICGHCSVFGSYGSRLDAL